MALSAILFDMDGTLVPMDTDKFLPAYFKYLAAALCPLGVTPEALQKAVWSGVGAMVRNDGSKTNEAVFWDTFAQMTGLDPAPFIAPANAFYAGDFNKARVATSPNPLAAEAVRIAHEKAPRVILATNPLFPMDGQITRMGWVGLTPADFDLVTSYESDSFCKPNPAYYRAICERIGVDPADCLMVGNDVAEDMAAAASVGMRTFLVTDCMIPAEGVVYDGPQGAFPELLDFLSALA